MRTLRQSEALGYDKARLQVQLLLQPVLLTTML